MAPIVDICHTSLRLLYIYIYIQILLLINKKIHFFLKKNGKKKKRGGQANINLYRRDFTNLVHQIRC